MWPLYNKKFIIINPSAMHITNFVSKIDKKIYLEGSISSIKKPQVVILQNQNLRGSVCNWAKPQGVIMHFSLYLIIAVCKFSDSDEGKSVHSNFLSGQQLCGWAHRSHARQVSNISVQINSNLDVAVTACNWIQLGEKLCITKVLRDIEK